MWRRQVPALLPRPGFLPQHPSPPHRLALAEGLLGGGEEGSQLSWKAGQECVAPGSPPRTDPQTYIV